MARLFTPEERRAIVKSFADILSARSIADLRLMAKLWGWPVKGTTKAAVVEGIVAKLCDPETMRQAFAALPEAERQVMSWISALPTRQGVERPLAQMLTRSTGKSITEAEVAAHVHDLFARGLLEFTLVGHFDVPLIVEEWLPKITPVALRYEKPVDAAPALNAAALSLHVDNLLNLVEADRPALALTYEGRQTRDSKEVVVGSGTVSSEILEGWGYETRDEQHLARFLLTAMIAARVVTVIAQTTPARLAIQRKAVAAWQSLAPDEQQRLLLRVWIEQLASPHLIGYSNIAWSEIELVLEFHQRAHTGVRVERVAQYYGSTTPPSRLINQAVLLAAASTAVLSPDTWFSFEHFCLTLRAYTPNLGGPSSAGDILQFSSGRHVLDANKMDDSTWLNTYGSLVAAWLLGPARWLGSVDVAVKDGQVVAFRRPERTREAGIVELPSDALRFQPNGQMVLRTIWQAGELRELVRQIASPVDRTRKTTTYRLDPAAFRLALHRGATAEQLVDAFASRGFPLPGDAKQRIELWQSRAGRLQIYDNLAAVEFADDLAQREVESAAGLGQRQAYAVSNRCSLLLDPDSAPEIVETLQRRGYIPKVLP